MSSPKFGNAARKLGRSTPAGALLYAAAMCLGQSGGKPSGGTVTFAYSNPKLQPAAYHIELQQDGSGRYHAEPGDAAPADIAALPAEGQARTIQVSPAVTERVFAAAHKKKLFAMNCETGGDKVAFQGKKMLSYAGPEGNGSCTYNYSKDAEIGWLTKEFEAIAATLEEGRKLEVEYEHGRLMLDAELETLEGLVRSGEATELENIAPTLRRIAGDDAVMERAQRRAAKLLLGADPRAGAAPGGNPGQPPGV